MTRPNKLVRLAFWLSGYKWYTIAVSSSIYQNRELIAVEKRVK